MSVRKKKKWGAPANATEATLHSAGLTPVRPPSTTPKEAAVDDSRPAAHHSADEQQRILEDRLDELQAAIPEGYQIAFVPLDQIRLDRPYDKEPIPESWVETTAQSIADEGLKHPIRLDQSHRILAGQVRTTALRLMRSSHPDAFRTRFPSGQIPVLVHEHLHWDQDPEACERELLVLQRNREMPGIKDRESFVLADAYRSLTDPRALWTSGGPTRKGMYRPISGLAQRWYMSERHIRNVIKPLRPYIEDRVASGNDAASLKALHQRLPPLKDLQPVEAPSKQTATETRPVSRGWKHYIYHAHKSATSLSENLQSVDSPLAPLAARIAQQLELYRREQQQPPRQLDPALVAELQKLLQTAADSHSDTD